MPVGQTDLGPLGTYTLTPQREQRRRDRPHRRHAVAEGVSEADFTKINIGVDASQIQGSAAGAKGTAGLFGQEANGAILTNIQQVANATSAGSSTCTTCGLSISKSSTGCFG